MTDAGTRRLVVLRHGGDPRQRGRDLAGPQGLRAVAGRPGAGRQGRSRRSPPTSRRSSSRPTSRERGSPPNGSVRRSVCRFVSTRGCGRSTWGSGRGRRPPRCGTATPSCSPRWAAVRTSGGAGRVRRSPSSRPGSAPRSTTSIAGLSPGRVAVVVCHGSRGSRRRRVAGRAGPDAGAAGALGPRELPLGGAGRGIAGLGCAGARAVADRRLEPRRLTPPLTRFVLWTARNSGSIHHEHADLGRTHAARYTSAVPSRGSGAVAQLVAHLHGMEGVRGSSPLSSTKSAGQAASRRGQHFSVDLVGPPSAPRTRRPDRLADWPAFRCLRP